MDENHEGPESTVGGGAPPAGSATSPWLNYPAPSWAVEPPPPPPRKNRRAKVVLSAALLVVVAMLAGFGVGRATFHARSTAASQPPTTSPSTTSPSTTSPSTTSPSTSPSTTSPSGSTGSPSGPSGPTGLAPGGSNSSSAAGGPSNASAIAAAVDPGLVDVNTTLGYQQAAAAGTGIVLTSSGEVLTNNHVIDGATSISVTDIGNGQVYPAKVVGYDRTGDVAILQLSGASGLRVDTLGDSSKIGVGEPVVAIGNAGGTGGTPSVAGGSVTGLSKSITASDQGGANPEQLTGLIEVNAAIQPGDSGGPIVDSTGKVLGMDTAASTGFSFQTSGADGYAIPINTAVGIAQQIESGAASDTVHIGPTAFLGVEVTASAGTGGSGGSGGSTPSGVVVAGVVSGSPSADAGLAAGDVITSLGGITVSSPTSLTALMGRYHPGDRVQLAWTDASQRQHSATVQLTTGPAA